MDTDAAFTGEANIDGNQEIIAREDGPSGLEGEESALLARGGIDSYLATPSAEDESSTPNQANDSNDARDTNHKWSRSTDFDGHAWYKRPSVHSARPCPPSPMLTCSPLRSTLCLARS